MSDCGKWVVKALNSSFVRKPLLGAVTVTVRADGRFGTEDPLNWPQPYCPTKPHLGMIPCKPEPGHPVGMLWETPQPGDFVAINDDPQGAHFGRLTPHLMSQVEAAALRLSQLVLEFCDNSGADRNITVELRRLENEFKSTLELFFVPFSYRDLVLQWAHLHRTWAECWAFLRYQQGRLAAASRSINDTERAPVPEGFGNGVMGAFTTDPRVAQQLYMAGVLVWFLQPQHVAENLPPAVNALAPEDVQTAFTQLGLVGHHIKSAQFLAGQHIETIWAESSIIRDVEHIPLPQGHELRTDIAPRIMLMPRQPVMPQQGRS